MEISTTDCCTAYRLGGEAQGRGTKRVPCQDPDLMVMVEGMGAESQMGDCIPLLDSWILGWNNARTEEEKRESA